MWHQIEVVGNVGRDPEMRYTPAGQAVTSFSVATNRSYTSSGGEQMKETIWFRVTTWGKLAEICNQYVKKGMKVLAVGTLQADKNTGGPRVWEKKDKTWASSFEINANTVRFLTGNGEQEHEQPTENSDPFA